MTQLELPFYKPLEIWYLAHPVSGASGAVRANLESAIRWLRYFQDQDPTRHYVAPWVACVMANLDRDVHPGTPFYDECLRADQEMVRRCNGVVMVGGRVSEGMARERACAELYGRGVVDLSRYVSPDDLPDGFGVHL